jgi:hypothetical protein
MKASLLLPGAALAIGLGVGFGIGKSGGSAEDDVAKFEKELRTKNGERGGGDGDANDSNARRPRSVDEIYRMPGQSDRIRSLLDYYSGLGPDEFRTEAEKLDGLPFNERLLASVLLFGKWAEVDPTGAMAFTDTLGFAGALVRPTVLQGWASTDPVNAAKYYSENTAQFAMMNMMGGGRGRGGMGVQGPAEIIASEWAKQDPEAAMKWASGLSSNKENAIAAVISEIAKKDPSNAASMAAKMEGAAQAAAYETIAKQWGAKNFSEATSWVNGLPAEQRGQAMAAAIEGLASSNPQLAAAEVTKMTDEESIRDVVPIVAKNLARSDVQGSMDWLNGISSDDAKQDAMRDVMPIWAATDSKAAVDFIKKQTSPAVKDQAAETYIWSNRNSSPSELVEVAGMISDEGGRSRATGIVAARWMQEDKEAATQFINGSDTISADMKERLLSGGSMWGERGRRGR